MNPPAPTPLTTPEQLRRWSLRCHAAGMSVGLVPTMGALHRGHLSLVERAMGDCDRVVVSIFVNPKQFGPAEDLARYPRTPDADLDALAGAGVHAVYLPSLEAMYPKGGATTVHVGGPLGDVLEAQFRQGHFDGVALVVAKLLIAARPERAYFGAKDAQQCAVVQRLAADLDTGVKVIVCPTVRDVDGLALSSRNVYLSPEQRRRALAIPSGIAGAAGLFAGGERQACKLIAACRSRIESAGLEIDYVSVVEPERCTAIEQAVPGCEILVAARIGATRLIDALRLGIDDAPVVPGAT
ncbi:MAG: pantoate--beta-alanine ligase [Candidatus Dormibacteria bacterium]